MVKLSFESKCNTQNINFFLRSEPDLSEGKKARGRQPKGGKKMVSSI